MFDNIRIELISFWLGFLAGILCFWLLLRFRNLIPDSSAWFKKKTQIIRLNLSKSTENRLREDTIHYAQRLHLAASLFSLDEIIIEPGLMIPRLSAELDFESVYQDITSELIPDMPDWPEMASCYGAPTFTLAESLAGGANIVVIGKLGSGKSTALVNLACQLARKSLEIEVVKNRIPLLVHVLDLPLQKEPKEIHDPITSAISTYASPLTQPHLDPFVRSTLLTGRALLILDGLDEITKDETAGITPWLAKLLDRYPNLQVVAAALSDDLKGLNQLGFRPLAIAAWSEITRNQFYDKWVKLWKEHIAPLQSGTLIQTDPILITQWLKTKERYPSPFEATLKAWALSSGDIRNSDLPGLIDCYIRRLTSSIPNNYRALERTAVHIILSERTALPLDEFRAQVAEFETIITTHGKEEVNPINGDDESKQTALLDPKTSKLSGLVSSGSQLISLFLNHGLLVNHAHSQIRFSHALFTTFLAGKAFAADGNITALIGQADWYGKWQTLGFAGCYSDISEVINNLIPKTQEDILARDLFTMAGWLAISPKQMSWRASLLRALAALVQHEYLTEGLAARAVCAIGLAGEPSIAILYRQWLKTEQPNLRRMGAFGSGLICDTRAVQELEALIEDPDLKVGKAACLALIAIANKAALDAVVSALLQGNEAIRRAAAESLVNSPEEGMRILQEGANNDDLLVRRSVVFGFMRSKRPDFVNMLEKMALEDNQWVVRNAASNALETLRLPNPYIPKPSPTITEIPWLIDFAGKQGIGVQAGRPAQDLICAALESGDEKEKLLALEHIRLHGSDYAIQQLYQAFWDSQEPIRQAAFDAIWSLAASGVNLPPPSQFGLRK